MPHLNDIKSKILGYIIAYIPVLAEPWSVLPAVTIAKSVRKRLLIHLKFGSRVAGTMHSEEDLQCQQP
jgi:hypothetical protein